jgi:hypothetical protein
LLDALPGGRKFISRSKVGVEILSNPNPGEWIKLEEDGVKLAGTLCLSRRGEGLPRRSKLRVTSARVFTAIPVPRRIRMSQATGTRVARETEKIIPQKEPTIDDIRIRAYEIFVAWADSPGDEVQDWLQAERELLSKES